MTLALVPSQGTGEELSRAIPEGENLRGTGDKPQKASEKLRILRLG